MSNFHYKNSIYGNFVIRIYKMQHNAQILYYFMDLINGLLSNMLVYEYVIIVFPFRQIGNMIKHLPSCFLPKICFKPISCRNHIHDYFF